VTAPDRLAEIFALQKSLNARIGVDTDKIQGRPEEQVTWLLNYARAIQQEAAELTDSVPWKWWAKYQKADLQNARVEVVDLMHFVVSAAQVLGMDAAEFHRLYTAKHAVNQARQDTGYAKKDEKDNRGL
jgi:dimeric dUTPase (all-alpha-NTP-PPase superfamily)